MLAAEFINYYCELFRVPYGLNDTNLRVVARPNLEEGRYTRGY